MRTHLLVGMAVVSLASAGVALPAPRLGRSLQAA